MFKLESIVYADQAGNGIPCSVILETNEGRLTKPMNVYDGSGFMSFPALESENISVKVMPDYPTWVSRSFNINALPGFATLTGTQLHIVGEPSAVPFDLEVDVIESGFIHTAQMQFTPPSGLQRWGFFTDHNEHWFMNAITMHTLITNVTKGQDITWVWDYMDSIGANTVLTISNHMSQWKIDNGFAHNALDPAHASILASLFYEAASRGKRVFIQSLADAQSLSKAQKQQIHDINCSVASGRWNVFVGKGNEWPVNGWHPGELKNHSASSLGGVLTSQGSVGGGEEPINSTTDVYKNSTPYPCPFLDFSQWETRIDAGLEFKMLDDAGAGILEQYHGYMGNHGQFGPCHCPVIVVETRIYNDTNPDQYGDFRGTDPNEAALIGANAGTCAEGFCFGTTESLVARPNGPIADECTRRALGAAWASFYSLYGEDK